jgi:glycogen operon protein
MSDQDWQAGFAKSLGVFLNGDAIPTRDEHGNRITDDSFYVMFNAHSEPIEFVLPESKWGEQWTVALDTNELTDHVQVETVGRSLAAGEKVPVQAWSLVLLRRLKQ